MNQQEKIRYFEYFIDLLIEWHIEITQNKDAYKQDFSRLKVLKMLFFASAVNSDETDGRDGLLNIFDNFHALPHGPVESDIYNAIIENRIPHYQLTERSLALVNTDDRDYGDLDKDILSNIRSAIEALRSKNDYLIQYKAFDLVDISHRWSCWTISCEIAKILGKGSVEMPHSLIKSSQKYYKL